MKRKLSLLFAALTAIGVVAVPTAAYANTLNCGQNGYPPDDNGPGCYSIVVSIAPGSWLAVHAQPNYTGGLQDNRRFYNGDSIRLTCWTTGAGDIDGNGDHYWYQILYGGYVNDWYVDTGSFSQWSPYIPHC